MSKIEASINHKLKILFKEVSNNYQQKLTLIYTNGQKNSLDWIVLKQFLQENTFQNVDITIVLRNEVYVLIQKTKSINGQYKDVEQHQYNLSISYQYTYEKEQKKLVLELLSQFAFLNKVRLYMSQQYNKLLQHIHIGYKGISNICQMLHIFKKIKYLTLELNDSNQIRNSGYRQLGSSISKLKYLIKLDISFKIKNLSQEINNLIKPLHKLNTLQEMSLSFTHLEMVEQDSFSNSLQDIFLNKLTFKYNKYCEQESIKQPILSQMCMAQNIKCIKVGVNQIHLLNQEILNQLIQATNNNKILEQFILKLQINKNLIFNEQNQDIFDKIKLSKIFLGLSFHHSLIQHENQSFFEISKTLLNTDRLLMLNIEKYEALNHLTDESEFNLIEILKRNQYLQNFRLKSSQFTDTLQDVTKIARQLVKMNSLKRGFINYEGRISDIETLQINIIKPQKYQELNASYQMQQHSLCHAEIDNQYNNTINMVLNSKFERLKNLDELINVCQPKDMQISFSFKQEETQPIFSDICNLILGKAKQLQNFSLSLFDSIIDIKKDCQQDFTSLLEFIQNQKQLNYLRLYINPQLLTFEQVQQFIQALNNANSQDLKKNIRYYIFDNQQYAFLTSQYQSSEKYKNSIQYKSKRKLEYEMISYNEKCPTDLQNILEAFYSNIPRDILKLKLFLNYQISKLGKEDLWNGFNQKIHILQQLEKLQIEYLPPEDNSINVLERNQLFQNLGQLTKLKTLKLKLFSQYTPYGQDVLDPNFICQIEQLKSLKRLFLHLDNSKNLINLLQKTQNLQILSIIVENSSNKLTQEDFIDFSLNLRNQNQIFKLNIELEDNICLKEQYKSYINMLSLNNQVILIFKQSQRIFKARNYQNEASFLGQNRICYQKKLVN